MIIDCFTYNGEADILEIRLNILNDYVDQFIICESSTTFSGKQKEWYFDRDKERVKKFLPKIKYFKNNEYENPYTLEEISLAVGSPNTQGATHWKHEFLQKERIKKALIGLKDDDIIYVGDCDEIWQPIAGEFFRYAKLKLRVYEYYLNNLSTEKFWGTIIAPYNLVKESCLNHLRTNAYKTETIFGWHFTSMGGEKELRRKLTDSYTNQSYATSEVLDNLERNIKENKDFLGRDFKYKIDESEWPQYLRDNREKYKHLLRS